MAKSESNLETSSCIVYMHVNKTNGKRYVGITSGPPSMRWAKGRGYYRNKHFIDAIEKYGWDGFDHIIVAEGLPRDEACEIERDLIKKYETTNKNKGYNLTSGGEHFKHSVESRAKMSQNRKGKKTGPFSEEHKRLIKLHHAGGNKGVPVLCVETQTIYQSINDASRATGINKKGISGCVRGVKHYNTAGGFHWSNV